MQHPHGRNVGRQLILTWSNCSRIQSNRSCYLCNNRLKQNTVKQFLSVETVGRQKSPGSKSADFLCSHDLFLSLNFCQHAQQNPAGPKTFSLFFFSARPHEVVCFSYKLKLVNVFVRRIRLHFVNNRLRQSNTVQDSRLKFFFVARKNRTTKIGQFANADGRQQSLVCIRLKSTVQIAAGVSLAAHPSIHSLHRPTTLPQTGSVYNAFFTAPSPQLNVAKRTPLPHANIIIVHTIYDISRTTDQTRITRSQRHLRLVRYFIALFADSQRGPLTTRAV